MEKSATSGSEEKRALEVFLAQFPDEPLIKYSQLTVSSEVCDFVYEKPGGATARGGTDRRTEGVCSNQIDTIQ